MIYYATTNQKKAFATEERCGEREAQGKHYTIVLGALLVDRQLKIQNKSLSLLLIIFFLSPVILFSKTPRHRPRPTSSAEAPKTCPMVLSDMVCGCIRGCVEESCGNFLFCVENMTEWRT